MVMGGEGRELATVSRDVSWPIQSILTALEDEFLIFKATHGCSIF
jgi:hypothetical protein